MNSRENMISRYLDELKAKEESESFEELEIRLRSIKMIRDILNDLKNENIFNTELTQLYFEDENMLKPDFIIHKNDINIPLFLKYYDEEINFLISNEELTFYKNYLKNSDYLKIIISWTMPPNFPSKTFTIFEIANILKAEMIIEKPVKNLKEIIFQIINEEYKILPIISPELTKNLQTENMLDLLINTCKSEFNNTLKKKRPRLHYKVNALNNINHTDVNRICLYLEQYFNNDIDQDEFIKNIESLTGIIKGDMNNDNLN